VTGNNASLSLDDNKAFKRQGFSFKKNTLVSCLLYTPVEVVWENQEAVFLLEDEAKNAGIGAYF